MRALAAGLRMLGISWALALAVSAAAQTPADFGDAPDNTVDTTIEAYPGIPGRFPTLLNTANAAVAGNKGPYHLTVNEEWLVEPGLAAATTTEADATLVDLDEDDAEVRIFCVAGLLPPPPPGQSAPPTVPCFLMVRMVRVGTVEAPRYVNALVDLDRDGDWRSALPLGSWPHEHVIVDKAVLLPAGGERGVISGLFFLNSTQSRWVRVTLTRAALGVAGWEGSVPPGGLALGETEDHLVKPFLVKPDKEHVSHFRLSATPPVVVVPPGGSAGFTVDITRIQKSTPPEIPATAFVLTVFGCQTIGGTGINIPPPAGYAGNIVKDVGTLRSPAILPTCVPQPGPVPCKESTEGPFIGDYDPPFQGMRTTTCWVSLAIDPPGEVYDYDDAYRSEVPVRFLQGVPDGDGDGVPDGADQCTAAADPNRIEDLDGFTDDDGCRDSDNDQDGVPDTDDLCPRDKEDLDGVADWDGCPDPVFFEVFADVPTTDWAWAFVETLYNDGVAGGCAGNPLRYCPQAAVTREQMAVFLLVSRYGRAYTPPPAQGLFQDVPTTSPYARWIEDAFRKGITGGCSASPPLYCPAAAVTREQMAVFLLRTLEGPAYAPPPAQGLFQDVSAASPFARWVEELYRRGITGGCSGQPLLFCPAQPVSRAAMAVFLVTTFTIQ